MAFASSFRHGLRMRGLDQADPKCGQVLASTVTTCNETLPYEYIYKADSHKNEEEPTNFILRIAL